MRTVLLVLACLCLWAPLSAQDANPSPIIFIYDASGSMWGQMEGRTKMEIAADVLSNSIAKLPAGQQFGFVAYGHRTKGDCEDVEFLVDVEDGSGARITEAVKDIKPLGKTPLAYSALQVIDKLRETGIKATIILVTDGIESCGGNLCEVIKAARAEGIDFKLHIIGFGLKDADKDELLCAAQAGNGNYYDAANAEGLGEVLDAAAATGVDTPDGNFTVFAIKNGVPIDAVIEAYSGDEKQRQVWARTYRDTASFYLPPGSYTLVVNPLEGTDVNKITLSDVESIEGQMGHRTVSFDAGKLGITTTNNGENWDCVVKLIGADGKVAAQTRTYKAPKEVEVNPGTYKVTIQALGTLEGLETFADKGMFEIQSGEITPVAHEFISGNFEIYPKVGADIIDTVVNITEINSGTNVAGSRTYTKGAKFLLNPGQYEVNVKPLGVHKGKSAQTFTMEVKQAEVTVKELNF